MDVETSADCFGMLGNPCLPCAAYPLPSSFSSWQCSPGNLPSRLLLLGPELAGRRTSLTIFLQVLAQTPSRTAFSAPLRPRKCSSQNIRASLQRLPGVIFHASGLWRWFRKKTILPPFVIKIEIFPHRLRGPRPTYGDLRRKKHRNRHNFEHSPCQLRTSTGRTHHFVFYMGIFDVIE